MKSYEKYKIAVFVSGPVRYADLVRQNLGIVLKGVEHDFFFHLWTRDLGKNVRQGYESDVSCLHSDPRTKLVIVQKPYHADFFKNKAKEFVGAGSPINAIAGMFLAIDQLCNLLKSLPDGESYTHILRIRTDCAILNESFLDLLNFQENVINSVKNDFIPDSWLSDHLTFCEKETFFRLWTHNSMGELLRDYSEADGNPELLLTYRRILLPQSFRVVKNFTRFIDYQIVYSPAIPQDPPWVKRCVSEGRFEDIFLGFRENMVMREAEGVVKGLESVKWKFQIPLHRRNRFLILIKRILARFGLRR